MTITLQQDTANNWQTVQLVTDKSFLASDRVVHWFEYVVFALALICRSSGSAFGNSNTWTIAKSLSSGDNHTLRISQGINDVNYSGLFSLIDGLASSSSSSSSTASSTDSSSMSTSLIGSSSSNIITSTPLKTINQIHTGEYLRSIYFFSNTDQLKGQRARIFQP